MGEISQKFVKADLCTSFYGQFDQYLALGKVVGHACGRTYLTYGLGKISELHTLFCSRIDRFTAIAMVFCCSQTDRPNLRVSENKRDDDRCGNDWW